ncbi:MAG: hypothetical protein NZM42_14190 [Gemmatales bacterium]|nr:hypothetical protein [Gemmatales bacterium]MDW8223438.1 hypothetical protein [Gemmatales bacterium]
MLVLSLEELRPFPEPEWLPESDYSVWVWLCAVTILLLFLIGLIGWWRVRRCTQHSGVLPTLQTLLGLGARLASLETLVPATSATDANGRTDARTDGTKHVVTNILDVAYVTLRDWWQQEMAEAAKLTPDIHASEFLQDHGKAAQQLRQILEELERARYCGRFPDAHWLSGHLEQACGNLALFMCSARNQQGYSGHEVAAG